MSRNEIPKTSAVDANVSIAGKLSYIQIPATDVEKTAAFYADVFGWTLRGGTHHRSFADPSGDLIGAFIAERPISREPGILPYLYVDDVERAIEQIVAHGGEVAVPPYPEGPLRVARFRDPSGNVIGIWNAPSR